MHVERMRFRIACRMGTIFPICSTRSRRSDTKMPSSASTRIALIFRARPLLNQPNLLRGGSYPVVLGRVIAECLEAAFERLPGKFGLAEHHA